MRPMRVPPDGQPRVGTWVVSPGDNGGSFPGQVRPPPKSQDLFNDRLDPGRPKKRCAAALDEAATKLRRNRAIP